MPWRINIQTDGPAGEKVGVHWPYARNRRKGSLRGDTAGETGTRRGAEALEVTPRRTARPGAGAASPGPWKPSEVTGDAHASPGSSHAGARGAQSAVAVCLGNNKKYLQGSKGAIGSTL